MKSRKILLLVVIFFVILGIAACSKNKVVKINSVSDLRAIKTDYETKTKYVLTKDLNLKNVDWEPLKSFYGTIDGKNHKISGLKISENAGGLFTSVQGTIKNLTIEGEITASYAGMFAGRLDEDGKIENCKSYGTITGSAINYVGGIVGTLVNGSINNCINYANIHGTTKIGGIIGDSWSKYHDVTISNCQNYGEIKGKNYVGGIVGNVLADASLTITDQKTYGDHYTYVKNCVNNGKVAGTDDFIGGLIGYVAGTESTRSTDDGPLVSNGYIELFNLTNNGAVEGIDSVGGIVGHEARLVTKFDKCINNESVKGNNYVGGIVGRNRSRQISNVTNNGIVTGNNYVGGVAGETSSIINSKNFGPVTASRYVGGVAGAVFGETDSKNLENHGTITTTGSHTGGIIGYGSNTKAALIDSNNYGKVTSDSNSYIDGIMGYNKNIVINNCHDYSKDEK